MTDKQSIADWIGLLYQERKLIDFLLVQSKERILFSQDELLPFCRNNPERFQRLLDQNLLIEKGGRFAASAYLFEYQGKSSDRFSTNGYMQLLIEQLGNLQKASEERESVWKTCLYQLEEVLFRKAEELSVKRDLAKILEFQQQIRQLRIMLLEEKRDFMLKEELSILHLELRQVLKELEHSMQRISQEAELPFNQKLRGLKEAIDQELPAVKRKLKEMLKDQHSFFLDQALQIKPRISSSHLEEEQALYTLTKNIR
ncbi:MAG: hypothetical protein R8P61_27485 [Bacteroidia bacterium]|nr:hypothetical protein [Bacteroidia bacterium]